MNQASSTTARIEQASTITIAASAIGWLAFHWAASPFLGVAGFTAIALGYSAFLGIEFIALRFAGRSDPAPRPTWRELFRAWVGETCMAPRVFCWRQPFRWNAVRDELDNAPGLRGRRGVVFIHGFMCNRGFWSPWMRQLQAQGHAFVAVNLEPPFGALDGYVDTVGRAVQCITAATGLPPVLVCHSMGGLAARAWLRTQPGDGAVAHIVTIGTPHHGTWLGRFSHSGNGRQMRLGSDWLVALQGCETDRRRALFTCWYSNCDNIVFPASTGTLAGARNRLVRGAAHVELAFRPEVMRETLALLAPPVR